MITIDLITRVFLANKQFVVVLLTGLAITSLITSSLTLTNYYISDLGRTAVNDLGYHMILYLTSREHSWMLENYTKTLKTEIVDRVTNVYVEVYEINLKKYNVSVSIDGKKANTTIARFVLLYIPGLDRELAYSPHTYYLENYTIILGTNITLNRTKPINKIKLSINNRTLNICFTTDTYYIREYLDKIYRKYSGIYVHATPRTGMLAYPYPYSKIFNQIMAGELTVENLILRKYYGPYVGRGVKIDVSSLIIMTGDLKLYKEFSKHLSNIKWVSIGWLTIKETVFEAGFLTTKQRDLYTGKLLLPIIVFNIDKLGISFSIDVSINKLNNYLKELRLKYKGLNIGIYDSPIHQRLLSMRGSEQVFRYTTVLSILPSLLIIWITASRIPPVLISILRKTIALLRIRGIPLQKIKYQFTYAFFLWLIPGGFIGFMLGPMIGSLLYKGTVSYNLYIDSLTRISDPLTITITFIITFILMIGAIRNSFNIISSVQPKEFTKPTILAELPLIEHGLSKLSIVLVLLATYYIIRVLFLNPYRILSGVTEASPLIYIGGFIMMILEPIVLLFGPVILVYAIAKIMIAYPSKTSYIASRIASIFTKKYRVLVARFIEIKPARISLAIVLSSFAISLLLGGLSGIDSIKTMFSDLGSAIHSDVDYMVYKPLLISDTITVDQLKSITRNATQEVNGSYTISFLLLGVMNPKYMYKYSSGEIYVGGLYYKYQKPYNILLREEEIPLGYILFIDKNFTKVVNVPSTLGINSDFRNAIESVERGDNKIIYVFNPVVEEEQGIPYSKEPYTGTASIFLGDKYKIGDYEVVCTARNLPVIGGFKGLPGLQIYPAEISFSEVAVIPLYAPKERGVIVSIEMFNEFINASMRRSSYIVGYVILFVKGEVDEEGLDRVDFKIYSLKELKYSLKNVENYMVTGLDFTISMGIALFIITLVVLGLLSYSIIYENLYNYTLMRGRGVPSNEVYSVSIAEAFAISLLSILPGLVLGIFLGYGLPILSTQTLSYTTLFLDTAYGVVPVVSLSISSALILVLLLLLPITVSLIMVYSIYKRVVREALILIGSHA